MTHAVDCRKCRHFVSCDSGKQAFYKMTGTDCSEFERMTRFFTAAEVRAMSLDEVQEHYDEILSSIKKWG